MMKYSFVLGLVLLLLGACGKSASLESVEQTDAYGYVEKFSRTQDSYARQGLYQKYTENGVLVEEANYTNDTLNGTRVLYYESGDTQIVENYDMGTFNGLYEVYHKSGGVDQRGTYQNNEMIGKWRRFYPNGQLMEEVSFENNEENGPFIEYYENGKLKAEGSYLNGDNEHGELKLYNENGELIRKMNCENGICRTFWKAEGIE